MCTCEKADGTKCGTANDFDRWMSEAWDKAEGWFGGSTDTNSCDKDSECKADLTKRGQGGMKPCNEASFPKQGVKCYCNQDYNNDCECMRRTLSTEVCTTNGFGNRKKTIQKMNFRFKAERDNTGVSQDVAHIRGQETRARKDHLHNIGPAARRHYFDRQIENLPNLHHHKYDVGTKEQWVNAKLLALLDIADEFGEDPQPYYDHFGVSPSE